jgi:hypothetical protein
VNELEKLLTEKVGLSPEQAQKAVTTMMGFLKEKLELVRAPRPVLEALRA